jgi:hypothetical protein
METGRVRKLRKLNGLEIYEYVAPKLGVIPGRPEGPGPESITTVRAYGFRVFASLGPGMTVYAVSPASMKIPPLRHHPGDLRGM